MTETAPVMIMAGGTGGHVFPGLAVVESLSKHEVPVVWLGSARGLEARLVPQAGIRLEQINIAGLRGNGLMRLLTAPFMLTYALCQAIRILMRCKPRLVLGMGGFASGPGGIAACCLRIPLVIHEQNAIAGLTNRILARFATRVLEAFPGSFPTAPARATLVGNPVRLAIAALAPPEQRFDGRAGAARLLVLGGSQGARILNRTVAQAVAKLAPEQRPEVWHQSGQGTFGVAADAYQEAGIDARVQPFIDDMAQAYAWADLVVCRAGALTVSELSVAGVGSLLVPYPYAVDDHQSANARFLERAGAAVIIAEAELNSERLRVCLGDILGDRERMLRMARAARRQACSDAATRVADICLQHSRAHPGTDARTTR